MNHPRRRTYALVAAACLLIVLMLSGVVLMYREEDGRAADSGARHEPEPVVLPLSEPNDSFPSPVAKGVAAANVWATTLLGSQRAVYAALAVCGLVLVAAVALSVALPILLSREEVLPVQSPDDEPEPAPEPAPVPPEPTMVDYFSNMSVVGQVFCIIGVVSLVLAVLFGVWNASINRDHVLGLLKDPLIELRPLKLWMIVSGSGQGLAFVGCAVLSLVSVSIGLWQGGAFSNLVLASLLGQPASIWLMVGVLAWLGIGVVGWVKNPDDDPGEGNAHKRALAILSFSMLLGAMGSVGGWWATGFSGVLLIGFALTLRTSFKALRGARSTGPIHITGFALSALFAIGSVVSVYFAVGAGGVSFSLAILSGLSVVVADLVYDRIVSSDIEFPCFKWSGTATEVEMIEIE